MAKAFSIGYGNRSIDEFIKIVRATGARFLLDVRSSPYSRYAPEFNREALLSACSRNGIRYAFLGDQLGGRPQSGRCYDSEGRIDYSRLEEEVYFLDGIKRLETAFSKDLDFVLMCSELRPEQCHRSKLIGRVLQRRGIQLHHIDADGCLVGQDTVISRIGGGQSDLFGEQPDILRSRKSYKPTQKDD